MQSEGNKEGFQPKTDRGLTPYQHKWVRRMDTFHVLGEKQVST